MVDSTLELVLITAAVVVVLYGAGFVVVSRINYGKHDNAMFPMMRPLILPSEPTALGLRLDAALRDAAEGFHACADCGFENLKRNIFCSLCGSTLERTTSQDAEAPPRKQPTQTVERRAATSRSLNMRRKARALKRKEWQRKVDVEGKPYWFRDNDAHGDDHARRLHAGGLVLHFDGEPLVAPPPPETAEQATPELRDPVKEPLLPDDPKDSDKGSVTVTVDAESSLVVEPREDTPRDSSVIEVAEEEDATDGAAEPATDAKPRLVLPSLQEIQQRLSEEMGTRPLTLLDSSAADPLRPAIVVQADSTFADDAATLVQIAQLDFPSKLAEFVTRTSKAVMVGSQAFLKMNVDRDKLLPNSIEALATIPPNLTRCPTRMSFNGEQGIDAGGVYREWLELVTQQLVSPQVGIFRCVDTRDKSFYLNATSRRDIGEHHLAHFFAAGRLLGRMLLEGNVTGFHLALPLLKIIVGQPVTLSDLEYFDADAYKSLRWLLENDGVDALGLDFTVTETTITSQDGGVGVGVGGGGSDTAPVEVVELVPNGRDIDVTDANKHEYVDRKLRYLLYESVQPQLFAFLKGLYEVMPPELLMLFDAEELDFVLSGSDEIDVDDWERNTKASIDLVDHPVRVWFWELVREMPNEYRRRLLLFATGSSRVPLAGFASLTSFDGRLCPFTLKGVSVDYEGGYIRSHACFNQLDLPRFFKKKDLKAVLYGVLDTDMYGFTSA